MVEKDTLSVLVAGESWTTYSIHIKGFDTFSTAEYQEGGKWLIDGLRSSGITVDYLPNHLAPVHFPSTEDELGKYDVVILSDIGSNSLLLHPDTFVRSQRTPNRLVLLKDWVAAGGALIMVGGYMTFQGIEGKARYQGTPIEEVLPVTMLSTDDRMEMPQGFYPEIIMPDHPILTGIPHQWPHMLFYNRTILKDGAQSLMEYNGDPITAVWDYGAGRAMAFTPDCGPAGAPPEFLTWRYYATFWVQAVRWLSKRA